MSKRKGSNSKSSTTTKHQKITQYLKTNIILKTTENECIMNSQAMEFTLEFPTIDKIPNSIIHTIPNPISEQPMTDDTKQTIDTNSDQIIDQPIASYLNPISDPPLRVQSNN